MTESVGPSRATDVFAPDIASGQGARSGQQTAFSTGFWAVLVTIFAIGAIRLLIRPTIANISWLFVVDNRWLDGEQIYRDFVETNPPMSAFLYMPAVLLERTGLISADAAQVIITYLLMAGSFVAVAWLLLNIRTQDAVARWLLIAGVIYACIPTSMISEREHIALILLLPSLALIELHDARKSTRLDVRLVIGFAAGLAICIKPHFAAALLLPQLWLCGRAKSLRSLFFAENWITGAVVLSYLGIILVFFRIYITDVLPMLAGTYRIFRETTYDLIFNPAFEIVAAVVTMTFVVLGRSAFRAAVMVPLLAAAGFLFAYFEQGKGWIYHLYPTMALVFVTFLSEAMPFATKIILSKQSAIARKIVNVVAVLGVVSGLTRLAPALAYFDSNSIVLVDRLKAIHPHPRLYVFTTFLSTGQPLTRMIGARWTGSFGHLFMTEAATTMPERYRLTDGESKALAMWLARDREIMASDLKKGQPDIILIDRNHFPWHQLQESGSEVVSYLHRYRKIDSVDDIDILVPATSPAPTVSGVTRAD